MAEEQAGKLTQIRIVATPKLMTRDDVAAAVGCHRDTVKAMEKRGELTPLKYGRKMVRFHPAEVAKLVHDGAEVEAQ